MLQVTPNGPWGKGVHPDMPVSREELLVNDALEAAGSACPRLTHGMNDWTWPLVADAFRRGQSTRVGFEDSVYLPNGTTARSNAQLVRAAVALRDAAGA